MNAQVDRKPDSSHIPRDDLVLFVIFNAARSRLNRKDESWLDSLSLSLIGRRGSNSRIKFSFRSNVEKSGWNKCWLFVRLFLTILYMCIYVYTHTSNFTTLLLTLLVDEGAIWR